VPGVAAETPGLHLKTRQCKCMITFRSDCGAAAPLGPVRTPTGCSKQRQNQGQRAGGDPRHPQTCYLPARAQRKTLEKQPGKCKRHMGTIQRCRAVATDLQPDSRACSVPPLLLKTLDRQAARARARRHAAAQSRSPDAAACGCACAAAQLVCAAAREPRGAGAAAPALTRGRACCAPPPAPPPSAPRWAQTRT